MMATFFWPPPVYIYTYIYIHTLIYQQDENKFPAIDHRHHDSMQTVGSIF